MITPQSNFDPIQRRVESPGHRSVVNPNCDFLKPIKQLCFDKKKKKKVQQFEVKPNPDQAQDHWVDQNL
jgi:hypothetical protein